MGKVDIILCIATDNQHIYVTTFDGDEKDRVLVLLRSQAYPPDLTSIKWEVVAKSKLNIAHMLYAHGCAATNGAFMILFRDAQAKMGLRGAFYESSNAMDGQWQLVGSSAFDGCDPSYWCSVRLVGVPGSSPPKFILFYHHQPSQQIRMSAFDQSTGAFDSTNATFEAVKMHVVDGNSWTSHYLIDYLSTQELAVVTLDNLLDTANNTSANYRVFETDDRSFPVQSRPIANFTSPIPYCSGAGIFAEDGGAMNGIVYFKCKFHSFYSEKENSYEAYTFSKTSVQLLASMGDFKHFIPVPAPNGTDLTWAIVEGVGGVYGFRMSGPTPGQPFSDDITRLSAKGVNDLPVWGIGVIVAGCLAAVGYLYLAIKRRRHRQRTTSTPIPDSNILLDSMGTAAVARTQTSLPEPEDIFSSDPPPPYHEDDGYTFVDNRPTITAQSPQSI